MEVTHVSDSGPLGLLLSKVKMDFKNVLTIAVFYEFQVLDQSHQQYK